MTVRSQVQAWWAAQAYRFAVVRLLAFSKVLPWATQLDSAAFPLVIFGAKLVIVSLRASNLSLASPTRSVLCICAPTSMSEWPGGRALVEPHHDVSSVMAFASGI